VKPTNSLLSGIGTTIFTVMPIDGHEIAFRINMLSGNDHDVNLFMLVLLRQQEGTIPASRVGGDAV
jgi:hypothetical protein